MSSPQARSPLRNTALSTLSTSPKPSTRTTAGPASPTRPSVSVSAANASTVEVSLSPSGSRAALRIDNGEQKQSVLERLTNPSNYTGSHKHRFDSDGRGRGIVGRRDVVAYTGSVNAPLITDAPSPTSPKRPVVTSPLGRGWYSYIPSISHLTFCREIRSSG